MAGETPGLLLSHTDTNLEKDFNISLLNSSSTKLRYFLLVPKKSDSLFASIKMGFNKDNRIEEMQFKDHLGHNTRIIFKNIKTNIPLANSLFIFKPSKQIDVIDETKH